MSLSPRRAWAMHRVLIRTPPMQSRPERFPVRHPMGRIRNNPVWLVPCQPARILVRHMPVRIPLDWAQRACRTELVARELALVDREPVNLRSARPKIRFRNFARPCRKAICRQPPNS